MTNETRTDVLIVGGGPTGLALAYQLTRMGVRCVLIEKNSGPSTTSKALGLQYRVSEVLAWMGVSDEFLARGVVGTTVRFHVPGRHLFDLQLGFAREMADREAFAPRAIVIPQSETEAILLAALRRIGGEVLWRTRFESFVEEADGVAARVVLADGTDATVRARYLVSCEGAHSTIRKQCGIEFQGKTYPLDFAMADVRLDWPHGHDHGHVWFHRDGMFAAMAMPGAGRWRLFVDITGVDPGAEVDLELMHRLMRERTGDATARASEPTWLTRFKINCRMVDRFRAGRVFLAGDAAHIHSPAGGQGITTGIQDAYNLAWKLALVLRGEAEERLLDSYEEERLPIAREVLKNTDQNTRVMWTHGRVAQFVRDRLVMPLLRVPAVQRRMIRRMTQLEMNYREGRLSQGGGRVARVRAGDRAPDVVLVDASTGGRTTLFARLQHSRFVAIAVGVVDEPAALAVLGRLGVDVVRVAAAGGEFARLYGARRGALLLVRPDGYLGYVGTCSGVQEYLARVWAPAAVARASAGEGQGDRMGMSSGAWLGAPVPK